MSLLTRLFTESVRTSHQQYVVHNTSGRAPRISSGDEKRQADRNGAIALSAAYTVATNSRMAYLKRFKAFKNHYLVDAIVSSIYDDAFTPDATSGEVVTITSTHDALRTELERLQKNIDIDSLVSSIVEDILGEGEVCLRTVVEPGKGLIDLMDDVDNQTVVALYDGGLPKKFLELTERGIAQKPAYQYVHFCLGSRKLKLGLVEEQNIFSNSTSFKRAQLPKDFPSYVRIGKPLFYGTLSKISELQLLESLIPSSKIAELTRGSVVGLSVPSSTAPKDAFDMCRKYENLFNSTLGVNRELDELTTADILGVAGRTKIIPVYGDKGQLASVSEGVKNTVIDDLLASVADMRNVICTSIGFPPELLFGGETKSETLKKYARYLRKLKAIQYAVAQGLKQMCMIHLTNLAKEGETNQFSKVNFSDIDVRFRNELISIDELEKLEFSDALVSTVQGLFEFFVNIKETAGFEDVVDTESVKKWLRDKMSLLRSEQSIINLDKERTGLRRNTIRSV